MDVEEMLTDRLGAVDLFLWVRLLLLLVAFAGAGGAALLLL